MDSIRTYGDPMIEAAIRGEAYRICERREINPAMVESVADSVRMRMCMEEMKPYTDMKERILMNYVNSSFSPLVDIIGGLPESTKESMRVIDECIATIKARYYPSND